MEESRQAAAAGGPSPQDELWALSCSVLFQSCRPVAQQLCDVGDAAIASTNKKGSPFCFSLLTSCCSAAGRMPAPGQAVFTCSLLFSLLQNPCAQVKAIPPITAVPMARPDLGGILALPLIANSWASPAALGTEPKWVRTTPTCTSSFRCKLTEMKCLL